MKIHSFRVVPALPERLQGLRDIAYNLLWSWDDELRVVFSRLDRDLWDSTYQNPVLMLGTIAQVRLAPRDLRAHGHGPRDLVARMKPWT